MLNLETRAAPPPAVIPLPEGDAGTETTIAWMRRLIDQGKKSEAVKSLAARILHGARVPAFDWEGEARAIYDAVRRNVRFTQDARGKEVIQSAEDTIRWRIGDCDDFVILLCSLLETIGRQTRIVTVSNHADAPDQFSHVYPEVLLGGRWVAVDAARRDPAFGRAPRSYFRKRIWSTSSPEFIDVAGLAGLSGGRAVPTALPKAFRPDTAPQYRFLSAYPPRRTRPRAPQGQGRYGRRAIQGLGDDDFNWAQLPADITAAAAGTANIIAASRAVPTNLYPTTSPSQPSYNPYGVTTAPASSGTSFFSQSPFGSGGPSWGVIMVIAVGLAFVGMRR